MDPLLAFWTAFTVVALAEFGDKTQIMAIVLASKYKRLPVLLGVMASLSILSLIAVLSGAVIFEIIPVVYVRVAAAIAFIIFGIWTLCSKEEDNDTKVKKKTIGKSLMIFAYVFWLITVAEFGDKTQLATIVLASSLQEPIFIFLGAVTAFFVVDAPGIYFGKKISEKVSMKYIKAASGILFLVLGIYFILEVAGIL